LEVFKGRFEGNLPIYSNLHLRELTKIIEDALPNGNEGVFECYVSGEYRRFDAQVGVDDIVGNKGALARDAPGKESRAVDSRRPEEELVDQLRDCGPLVVLLRHQSNFSPQTAGDRVRKKEDLLLEIQGKKDEPEKGNEEATEVDTGG